MEARYIMYIYTMIYQLQTTENNFWRRARQTQEILHQGFRFCVNSLVEFTLISLVNSDCWLNRLYTWKLNSDSVYVNSILIDQWLFVGPVQIIKHTIRWKCYCWKTLKMVRGLYIMITCFKVYLSEHLWRLIFKLILKSLWGRDDCQKGTMYLSFM